MDRHRLDYVALMLAAPRSRRQAIRAFAAGMLSTVVLGRAARPVAAALCPNRVPREGYRPEVNGCGPSGYGWMIPDSFGNANFTPACNHHDRCYGTCNQPRLACDKQMRQKMRTACERAFSRRDGEENWRRLKCLDRANMYFKAVRRGGQGAYEDAQNEACTCCDAPSLPCGDSCCNPELCMTCAGGTCVWACPRCHYCNNGVCIDCGQDTCCGG